MNLATNSSKYAKQKFAGFEVAHVVHRHGMSDETALEVGAALISDARRRNRQAIRNTGYRFQAQSHPNQRKSNCH